VSKQYLTINVHSSAIHKSQKEKTNEMFNW
jgi:hypothetical protein